MKRKISFIWTLVIGLLTIGIFTTGCKKQDVEVPDKQEAFFVNSSTNGNYRITAPGQVFKIPVGLTKVAGEARNVSFTITSPTGAVLGTHYTIASNPLSIPTGKVIDSLEVRAVFSQYQAGRKDTLIIKIADGDKSPNIRNTYRLAISGPCFEGDVNLNLFLGAYRNTNEDFGGAYGPYTTTVTAVSSTGPTTGTITVSNIYDAGWNPITFKLDWTNPANRTVMLDQQSNIGNAGTLSSANAGQDISVRNHANGQVGTFSICNQTINLKLQVGVTAVSWFGTLYTVNMAR